MPIILHIDFDSFFASVEQQCNPALQGKPIGVTATNGRTCIIAASREAKRYGVETGGRTYDAFRRCPQIQLVSADFAKYFEVSKKFLALCKDFSPYVELFSIDEVFMDVTATHMLFGGVDAMIQQMKERIAEEIGEYITVSVGISYNKLLAKLASGMQKPNGIFRITPQNRSLVYHMASLTDICGIGQRIAQRLRSIGVYSLAQLEEVPLYRLIAEFGKMEGYFLKNVGMGLDATPVVPYTDIPSVKSVGRNYCLPHNEYDQRIILQQLYEISEDVARRLRLLKRKGRTVGLSLRGHKEAHGRKTLPYFMDTGKDIFAVCRYFYKTWHWHNPSLAEEGMVRMISLWVETLQEKDTISLPLFTDETKKDTLWATVDNINERFGDYTIRNAFLLYADKLKTVPNGYFADKQQRTQLAMEGS